MTRLDEFVLYYEEHAQTKKKSKNIVDNSCHIRHYYIHTIVHCKSKNSHQLVKFIAKIIKYK